MMVFSHICKQEEKNIPTLRQKIQALSSGDNVQLNGIERDILTAGLDLVVELLKAEAQDA